MHIWYGNLLCWEDFVQTSRKFANFAATFQHNQSKIVGNYEKSL